MERVLSAIDYRSRSGSFAGCTVMGPTKSGFNIEIVFISKPNVVWDRN